MNTVVFVNPPNHSADTFDLAPPLGLMVLAEIAMEKGWHPHIVDLSVPNGSLDVNCPERFYDEATRRVMDHAPSLVCFTSMGVNTHIALELARRARESDDKARICAGGVHMSSIYQYINETCPWVDVVVGGEGEIAFRQVLDLAASNSELPAHLRNEKSVLPRHPHRAYDWISLNDYFGHNDRKVVNYEGGRGCIFKCAFCYSPAHYTDVRDVQPSTIVDDWTKLADRGARHIFMVQDNFTNAPKQAIATCDALAAADLPVTWNGYATLPQICQGVASALGRAKCRQMYLGVDAVTPTQRVSFNKRFYRSNAQLLARVDWLLSAGVEVTCAFMIDPTSEDEHETEQVFRVAADCAAIGASIRLNTFTRYPGSSLANGGGRVRYSTAKVATMFDCPRVVIENPLAESQPRVFPFHCTEVEDEAEWVLRLKTVRLAQRLLQAYPDYFRIMRHGSENVVTQGLTKLAMDPSAWEDYPELEFGPESPSSSEVY